MTKPPGANPSLEPDAPLVPVALWGRVEETLSNPNAGNGRPRLENRRVLSGILYVRMAKIAWNDLPKALGFGAGNSCRRRLEEWRADGSWDRFGAALKEAFLDRAVAAQLQPELQAWRLQVDAIAERSRPAAAAAQDRRQAPPPIGRPVAEMPARSRVWASAPVRPEVRGLPVASADAPEGEVADLPGSVPTSLGSRQTSRTSATSDATPLDDAAGEAGRADDFESLLWELLAP